MAAVENVATRGDRHAHKLWRAVTALTLNASAIGPTGSWRSVEGDGRPHGGQGNSRTARRRAYGHASSRGRVGPASAASHEHGGGGAAAAAVVAAAGRLTRSCRAPRQPSSARRL